MRWTISQCNVNTMGKADLARLITDMEIVILSMPHATSVVKGTLPQCADLPQWDVAIIV